MVIRFAYNCLDSKSPKILRSGFLDIAVLRHYNVKGPNGGADISDIEPGDIVYSTL